MPRLLYLLTLLSVRATAPDAEVTITEKTVSVKKEKVTMVGDMETRVVESSPTFSETLMPITEVTEGDTVMYVPPPLHYHLNIIQAGHKPGKTWKPGTLGEFSEPGKLVEFSGNSVQTRGKNYNRYNSFSTIEYLRKRAVDDLWGVHE